MKHQPTPLISQIKIGNHDNTGNMIINVLSHSNEYAIYEIESKEPENRLRVLIDGLTNKRETILASRFNEVKQNYVLAKGLLYRSQNFNLMKGRVAHALSTALSSNDPNPNKVFEDLIHEIRSEYNEIIWRRLIFVLPGYLLFFLLCVNSLINIYYPNYLGNEMLTQIMKFVFATVIGCVLSMTYSVQKLFFETEPSRWFYFLIGCERLSLSIFAGVIIYVGIKSKIAFGELITSNHYASLFMGFVAGFFETFIPNILKKQLKV